MSCTDDAIWAAWRDCGHCDVDFKGGDGIMNAIGDQLHLRNITCCSEEECCCAWLLCTHCRCTGCADHCVSCARDSPSTTPCQYSFTSQCYPRALCTHTNGKVSPLWKSIWGAMQTGVKSEFHRADHTGEPYYIAPRYNRRLVVRSRVHGMRCSFGFVDCTGQNKNDQRRKQKKPKNQLTW